MKPRVFSTLRTVHISARVVALVLCASTSLLSASPARVAALVVALVVAVEAAVVDSVVVVAAVVVSATAVAAVVAAVVAVVALVSDIFSREAGPDFVHLQLRLHPGRTIMLTCSLSQVAEVVAASKARRSPFKARVNLPHLRF